jgi:teichuronic acid biosynthesis glycosyltransferase TuaC
MMKILIVCSGNAPDFNFEIHHAFISDQVIAISHTDSSIQFDYFFINGKGIKGYLLNRSMLFKKIRSFLPDIIHAHFAFSGLLSNLQRHIPVITTFHGSDINFVKNRLIAQATVILDSRSIFISEKLYNLTYFKKNGKIIPCGVDLEIFNPLNKELALNESNLDPTKKYILFSSHFDNKIKNYNLLKEAISQIGDPAIKIIELKGYSRKEVSLLMNVADVCIMTSFSEGSPQFIKEAMACNRPIVSTDVGDVKWIFGTTDGCYCSSFDPSDVENKIKLALQFSAAKGQTNGRQRIIDLGLDNKIIAERIIDVYNSVLENKN